MQAILNSFLEDQHQGALRLLDALIATTERGVKTRTQLLEKLEGELYHHMLLEEEVVYPALETAVERKQDLRLSLARAEHDVMKAMLKELDWVDPASPEFGGKLKALKELIERHVAYEEASVFPLILEVFTPAEVTLLARRVFERHEELEARRAWSEDARVMAFASPE